MLIFSRTYKKKEKSSIRFDIYDSIAPEAMVSRNVERLIVFYLSRESLQKILQGQQFS